MTSMVEGFGVHENQVGEHINMIKAETQNDIQQLGASALNRWCLSACEGGQAP